MRISDWSSDVCSADLTPGMSCSSAVLPVLPDTSPRSTRACRRPPLALSTACAAGDSTLSAKTPTMTQSVVAVAGVDWFRANSRVMGLYGSLESGWPRMQRAKGGRSEEHTSELQSLLRNAYADF